MKATIFTIAAFLAPAVVLAQDTTTTAAASGSTCAADYIVETCLSSTGATQEDCGQQDYTCQCAAYQAMVTCFNNCPGDPRQTTYSGLVTQYCALASQYASTNTPAATGSQTATGSTAAATTGTATTTGTSTSTATSSGSSSSATVNSAAGLVRNAGGVMAVVAGAVAALL